MKLCWSSCDRSGDTVPPQRMLMAGLLLMIKYVISAGPTWVVPGTCSAAATALDIVEMLGVVQPVTNHCKPQILRNACHRLYPTMWICILYNVDLHAEL